MAQATATYLAKNPQTNTIAAVYSSPLDRTRETAGAILDALNPVREACGEAPLTLTTDAVSYTHLILVGKDASYDGSTIIARNEDSANGEFNPKRFIVVKPEEQPREYKSVSYTHLCYAVGLG